MLNEEQVIDVESQEVVEEEIPDTSVEQYTPPNPYDQYVDFKKQTYKYKQLKKQMQNNIKSQRGFGYTYKEIQFD
jgi:hypothetical protein